jgi:hypothetical protein
MTAPRALIDPTVVRRRNELLDLYHDWTGDGDPDDDPEFVDAAREIMGLSPLAEDDDDEDVYDEDPIDPEVQAAVIARLGVDLDVEDEDDEELTRVMAALDHNQLKTYWTKGKGLARWIGSPHPWTTLYRLLRRHVGSARAKRMASEWLHEVTGLWSGSDAHRVSHGGKMRGKVIGPG